MSDVAPVLVAYRDGFTDDKGVLIPWKSLTPSTSVQFMAEGAYSVTVVCIIGNQVMTWQASHTVDDDKASDTADPMLQTPCSNAPTTSAVTGTQLQAGTVHLDDDGTPESSTANSQFSLSVANGTHDLIASDPTDKKALIQRNIVINGAKDLGVVDAATGLALTSVTLTLDNPPKAPDPTNPDDTHTETVEAQVSVTTKNNSGAGEVFFGGYDLVNKKVSAFAYPNAMLTADDAQSATFVGKNQPKKTTITTTRSQTRPLDDKAASGMTTFQLPALISIPGWGSDPGDDRLSVALPALPALDDLTISTFGPSTDGTKTAVYMINITAEYFQDTGLARPVFDTSVPSFQAAWKVDFSKHYTRTITAEHDVVSKNAVIGHETSKFSEEVNAP
jgi:hypothetical protein